MIVRRIVRVFSIF